MAKAEKPAADAAAPSPRRIAQFVASVRRLPEWVRAHRIKAAVIFSAAISVFGGLLFTWAVMHAEAQQRRREASYVAADALAALDAGDMPKALHIAQCVARSGNVTTDDAGGPAFIFGLAALRRAATPLPSQRRHSYKVAAYWFEEARRLGFPPGREAEGLQAYGTSLYFAGRYAEAVAPLREAAAAGGAEAEALRFMLAESLFLQPRPDVAAALATLDARPADAKSDADDGGKRRLLRAELLLRLDRPEDSRRELESIDDDDDGHADKLVLEARLLMREAEQTKTNAQGGGPANAPQYERIVELLKRAQREDGLVGDATPRAFYLLGLCYLRLDKTEEAATAFHQAYRRAVDSPEGLAARIESAAMAQRAGKNDDAVRLYREILDDLGDVKYYGNRWLSLADLQKRLLVAYQAFLTQKQYQAAADLAAAMPKVVPEDEAVQLEAEAFAAWARHEGPADVTGETYERLLSPAARDHFRTAARLHERLATLRFARREYPDEIWTAARFYLLGRDLDNAARMYRKYLRAQARVHHAQALVGLAEVLLTKQRYDEASACLKECLDLFPQDPAAYRARLVLAQLYVELNQWQQAEEALTANLESDGLTPQGEEWRRSLFALGRLWYDLGRYADAAERLDEAVERYPTDAETPEARYRAAEAHRRTAQQIENDMPADALPAERTKFVRRAQEQYEAALARFDEAIKAARTPDPRTTDEAGRIAILRNSVFARGAVLYALGRYQESVQAYHNAVASFPQSPAVLDAYLQIADCYRRLNRTAEMRGTLEQAKLMLDRLPKDAEFDAVSNFSRDDWRQVLDDAGS